MADSKTDKPARPAPPRERKGWLTRLRPGVRSDIKKGDTPENLWVKDPESGEMLYRPDLEAAQWVTPSGHHMRIGAAARLSFTFDDGEFERIASPKVVEDPLNFPDERPYKERLAAARKSTGEQDSMAVGVGKVGGQPAVVIVQDFSFMGGSLGMGAGETFVKAAQEAVAREVPLVIFTASGGARMQEGTLSLMQMARTTLAVNEVKAAGLPYVVVLTDPTTGGVLASYAMLGDIHLAEPKATIGFSGRRVIEQTIREILPPAFQKSEFLVEHGMIDRVVARPDIPAVLGNILETLMMGRARRAA
ncbi:acetyl-CoA carboxylase, carboxyltransferase subunit beta [Phenylobacterium sp. LjRoot225]|uniref:acetyl-CoA carboxylase, carboxyltransferase subunit beta n=1 Tax=Phenylobacterium sp. LjRoot225 TaxID=3342285 RepID=UPI003ED04294